GVIDIASCMVRPCSFSVSNEAHAIEVVHPRQRNFACANRPFSTRAASCTMSPQTGLATSTWAVAQSRVPALRGCSKWSRTAGLNMCAMLPHLLVRCFLLRRKILLLDRRDNDVIRVHHFGDMGMPDLREKLIGVQFRKPILGVDPAH